jgi:coiled-coil domain-containing protein 130
MRHTVCSGWLEIRTDPKNTAYVVQEGAKKKSADDQPPLGIIKIHDPADAAAAEDPFAKAEKSVKDKTETKVGAARIRELRELSDRQWLDPYEHSCKMRKVFRVWTGNCFYNAVKNGAWRILLIFYKQLLTV